MDVPFLKLRSKFLVMKKENHCHVRMLILTKTKFGDTERDFVKVNWLLYIFQTHSLKFDMIDTVNQTIIVD